MQVSRKRGALLLALFGLFLFWLWSVLGIHQGWWRFLDYLLYDSRYQPQVIQKWSWLYDFPLPSIVLALSVLPLLAAPAVYFTVWRRWLPPDTAPRCERCRYNLTGNTSGKCPECGATIERDSE